MRVFCALREIQEEAGYSKSDLVRELGIDARTIEKLLADSDSDPWRLDRSALHRYALFAHAHSREPFEITPNHIWKTFENKNDVEIFRGSNRADAVVEEYLHKYLESLHSQIYSTSTVPDGLKDAMKRRNCLIIGSPKLNRASEIALAELWGANPFDASAENRELIPLHVLGMELASQEPSALVIGGTRHGFDIKIPDAQRRKHLKVDWLSPERYKTSTDDGQDAAILVVCNRPFGTDEDVTTVIIAGYTGLSTLEAAREAAYRNIPDLDPTLNPGQPSLMVLKFGYKKRTAAQRRKSLNDLRLVKEGTAQWGPPWGNFFG